MSIEFTCPECGERNTVGPEFGGRRGTCAFCGAQVIVPQSSGVAQSVAPLQQAGPQRSSTPWVLILAIVCGVLVLCGGILAALLLPAINAAREAGRRASCTNKLRQINLALLNYESTYGHLPPAASKGKNGDPPMSWRVAILPFMEQDALYRRYRANEPWDSPANRELAKIRLQEFVCPSDTDAVPGETSYVMITGENTIGGKPGSPGIRPAEFSGNRGDTIMVLEVHGLKIPWTEPRDITLAELAQRLRANGGRIGHVAGFNVGFADGSVKNISPQIDPGVLRSLAIINGGQPVDDIGDD
jgi:prepilin-type processing-associated H-X9-DG protein